MKKLNELFFIVLLFCLVGCEKDDDRTSDQESGDNGKNEECFAPLSLKNKTIHCPAITNEEIADYFTFSSSSFSADYGNCAYFMSIYGTPSYTYVRKSNTTAELKMTFTDRMRINSSTSAFDTNNNDLVLTFTSETGGYISGDAKVDNFTYHWYNEWFTIKKR